MPPRKTKVKTKKHHFHVTHIPISSWIVFWLGVAATFVLIFVTFGSAFNAFLSDDSDWVTGNALQQINQNLVKQIADSQNTVEAQKTIPEGRLLVNDLASFNGTCDVFNTSTEIMTVPAVTEQFKVAMNIPYNFDWGNEKFAISPYSLRSADMVEAEYIRFGPMIMQQQTNGYCNPFRDSEMTIGPINPKSSMNNERHEINTESSAQLKATNIRERTINGVPVLSYKIVRNGVESTRWSAYGRNFHYEIVSNGWLTDAEAIKIIQSLRVVK